MEIPAELKNARVALVHDWLLTWRGGEKVLEAMAELFPSAPIYTLFHDSKDMPSTIESHRIVPSVLNRIPGARSRHRHFLPLMPGAIRMLDVGEVDLVLSSSHCVAKGIPVPKGAKHVSYVHAPLRYMWDRFDDYFGKGKAPLPVRAAARLVRPGFRLWDVLTSAGVDRFITNSGYVAQQVAERYHRTARVIHPPVELERFTDLPLASGSGAGGYFLCFGALAPYKRLDLAIEAFRRNGRELWIAGSGQSGEWLRDLPPNVKALGQVRDDELPDLLHNARALVFPGVEDFGIAPLEMQACGRPVIAFGRGGALETVTAKTGVFFQEQTVDSLLTAIAQFDVFEADFEPADARAQAMRFSKRAFHQELLEELTAAMVHR